MPRLLPRLAICFAAGIVAADLGYWVVGSALQLGLASFCVGLFAPRTRAAAAMVVSMAAGALALALPLQAARLEPIREGFDAVVEGRVCDRDRGARWVSVDLCHAQTVVVPGFSRRSVPSRIRLSTTPERSGFDWLASLDADSWVRVRARVRPLSSRRNPGARALSERLARQAVGARANPLEPLLAVRIRASEEPPVLGIAGSLEAFRLRLARKLKVHGSGGGLAAALVLGDPNGVDRERREAYRALGISHLLAISGLHVMWMGGMAYALTLQLVGRWPWLGARGDGRRWAAVVALLVAGLYVLVAGAGIPVQRAWILLVALVAGVLSGRRVRASEALAAAGLVILATEPAALFELGPQLSFAASAALLFGRGPALREGREERSLALRFWVGGWALLRVTATAMAVSIPLLAIHGLPVTLLGLVSNLLLVPLFAMGVLPLSMLAVVLASLPGTEAGVALVCHWIAGLASGLDPVGALAVRFLFAVVPREAAVAFSLCIGWGSLALRSTGGRVLAVLGVVLALVAFPSVPQPGSLPRVVVLDVGQGDAIVVQGRRAVVVVDGGWASPGGADLGRSVVVPALRALGVGRIDVVIATHADADHRGGLPAVLDAIPVSELWLPAGGAADPAFAVLVDRAAARGVALRERSSGDALALRGDLQIATLWPPEAEVPVSRNDGSLVTRIDVDGFGVLIPGDVGRAVEARLLAANLAAGGDVLVVPHHGSRGSSSRAFLDAVGARVAVVSAPCRAGGRLPSADTLSRVEATGAATWWTGRDGAVEVRLRPRLVAWGFAGLTPEQACRWTGA